MKKIITFLAIAFIAASCTTEDANIDKYEAQNVDQMNTEEFKSFMDKVAINRGALPYELNPDDSFYPFPIESIIATGEEKMIIIGNPTIGGCVDQPIKRTNGTDVGNFKIARKLNPSQQQKVEFNYTAAEGWYISSVSMNIAPDCNNVPLHSNGEPNVCGFNVRNSFSGRRTSVKYKFAGECIPDCACVAAYVVMYTLNSNNSVDQCIGVWVDGESLAGSAVAKSNEFCKAACGEVQDN